MNDQKKGIFTDEEMQRLVLAYMYSRKDEPSVPTEDIQAFINACKLAVIEGTSVKMVAEGLLNVRWDKDTGVFEFDISEKGIRLAEEQNAAA